ncbi:hypothetical protein SRIMM317S_05687 [Streptomyces rimosus subsp. rimosus]
MPRTVSHVVLSGGFGSPLPRVSRAGLRTRMATEAPPTRNGTTRWNTPGGVASRSAAPAALPRTTTRPSLRTADDWPASSRRELGTTVMLPMARETVLVTLAVVGDRPAASSAG